MELNILSMEHITKVYSNGFVADKDIHFSVHEGEIHALIGENGAGKSTLMKVLFGTEKPDQGRILLRGRQRQDSLKEGISMLVYKFFDKWPIFQWRIFTNSFCYFIVNRFTRGYCASNKP